MDSIKGIHYGVEDDGIYLVVVVVDAGTRRFGRKSSPEVHWKPSCAEFQRLICGATSGGSKNGLYFWNSRVEGYSGIYIYTGFVDFGKSRYFSNYCFSELK